MTSKTELTVPVFANRAPWNELLMRGQRRVKTLSFNWKHRGPILLYTSLARQDDIFGLTYKLPKGMKLADFNPGAIVGTANVVDVLPVGNLPEEFYQHDPNLWETTGQNYVVIVADVKRFEKPFPFKPPQGAIRIFRAPILLLKRATVALPHAPGVQLKGA